MTKQKMEKHLNAIWCHYLRLENALNRAHRDELIDYKDYETEAPCRAMDILKDRIEATTKAKIAELIHRDIRRRHWY